MHLRRLVAGLGSLFLLAGCTFSTGYRTTAAAAPDGPPVTVALTEGFLHADGRGRAAFRAQTDAVRRSLADQPGLVGYALKFEPFGNRVWTMTVWQDDESLAAFARGSVHMRAMREGFAALDTMRSARVRVARADLPLSWEQAAAIVARDGRGYYD